MTATLEVAAKANVAFLEGMIQNLEKYDWTEVAIGDREFSSTTVGTGAATIARRMIDLDSGVTAGATAIVQDDNNEPGYNRGKAQGVIDWSKRIVLALKVGVVDDTTNGLFRVTLGKAVGDGVQDLDDKGIGIRVAALDCRGHDHNGVSATTTDLSTSLTEDIVHTVVIMSDGQGNVEYLIDGASVGSSTGGPTGDSTSWHVSFSAEVDNGADNARHRARVHKIMIGVEQ